MIDTHAHYDHRRFNSDRDALLQAVFAVGVQRVINLPITLESNHDMRAVLANYPGVYYGAGLHPNCAAEIPFDDAAARDAIRTWAVWKDTVTVGETGLDFHRTEDEEKRLRQRMWFEWHLELAGEVNLPLALHMRDAEEQGLEILRSCRYVRSGVVHCFSRDYAIAKQYLDLGFALGIGGRITHAEAGDLRDAVRRLPMDALLLETDAPFVQPVGAQGGRNSSLNLPLIVQEIAAIKGMREEEVVLRADQNAERLFFPAGKEGEKTWLTAN